MTTVRSNNKEQLRKNLQEILGSENLDNQRAIIKTLTTDLGADFLDFAENTDIVVHRFFFGI